MRVTRGHEHTKTTLSIEKELLELFSREYPDVNISYLLEVIMQEALKLKGISYTLYEDEVFEKKAEKAIKSLRRLIETTNLARKIFSEKLLERVEKEGKLHKEFL